MTHTSVAADHFAESDFRVGSVISRSASVLSCRFLTFFIVAVVASSPMVLLIWAPTTGATDPAQAFIMLGLFVLLMVLSTLSRRSSCTRRFRTCAIGPSIWPSR